MIGIDANVLVALAAKEHPHHYKRREWSRNDQNDSTHNGRS